MTTVLLPVTQGVDRDSQGGCKSRLGQSDASAQGEDILAPPYVARYEALAHAPTDAARKCFRLLRAPFRGAQQGRQHEPSR